MNKHWISLCLGLSLTLYVSLSLSQSLSRTLPSLSISVPPRRPLSLPPLSPSPSPSRSLGLYIRGVEEESRSRREGLFHEEECIVKINHTHLMDKTFSQ